MDYLAHLIVVIAAVWLGWHGVSKWRTARHGHGAACGSCPSCAGDEGDGRHSANAKGGGPVSPDRSGSR